MNDNLRRPQPTWNPLDDKVARWVKAEAERHPRWPDKQNLWGLVLLSSGDYSEAADVFGRSLEVNPRYSWASLNRVHALALAGDVSGARQSLAGIVEPPGPARAMAAAFIELLEGRIESAAQRIDGENEETTGRADVRRLRVAILRAQNSEAAKAAWEELRAQLPIADAALAAPWDESGSVAARYVSFVPGLHHLWYEASTLFGRTRSIERSERAAAVAMLLWAKRDLYLYQRALLASFRGEDETALGLYSEASEWAPADPKPHIALAFHWSAQGELERARASMTAALERAPRYPDLHYQMGLLSNAFGENEKALNSFRRALDINPRYTAARVAEAGTLFALEQWSAARDAYAQVLEAGMRSADIHMHLGQIEERLGRSEGAEAAYREAIHLNPREAQAHYLIGDLYRRQGDRESAGNAWRTFLKLSHDPERVAEVEAFLKSA